MATQHLDCGVNLFGRMSWLTRLDQRRSQLLSTARQRTEGEHLQPRTEPKPPAR